MGKLAFKFKNDASTGYVRSINSVSNLELLFDLIYVIGFGIAADNLAELLAEGYYLKGASAFILSTITLCWTWGLFTWLNSAFYAEDWLTKILSAAYIGGLSLFCIGIPDMFEEMKDGWYFKSLNMILGFVVMRVVLIILWLRVGYYNQYYRKLALANALIIFLVQTGWVISYFYKHNNNLIYTIFILLILVGDFISPMLSTWLSKTLLPWNPEHIYERYQLMILISLGELLAGTVSSLRGLYEISGWSFSGVVVAMAGIIFTFSIWNIYFLIPFDYMLRPNKDSVKMVGESPRVVFTNYLYVYGHLFIFAAVAAVGVGMRLINFYFRNESSLNSAQTYTSIYIPIAIIFLVICLIVYSFGYKPSKKSFNTYELIGVCLVIFTVGLGLSYTGISLAIVLLVVCLPCLTLLSVVSIVKVE